MKKRIKLTKRLEASQKMSVEKSYPTVPYEGDDEAFIIPNLSLVPRKLQEFLTKEDRRELVEVLRRDPRNLRGETTLLENQGQNAFRLFHPDTRELFRHGGYSGLYGKNISHEVMSDPMLDAEFYEQAEQVEFVTFLK